MFLPSRSMLSVQEQMDALKTKYEAELDELRESGVGASWSPQSSTDHCQILINSVCLQKSYGWLAGGADIPAPVRKKVERSKQYESSEEEDESIRVRRPFDDSSDEELVRKKKKRDKKTRARASSRERGKSVDNPFDF